MATAAQIEANRRNALKSTGPRTQEGKNRSRFNALDHGFRANILVLPTEQFGEHANHLAAWRRDWRPRNATEDFLVESVVTVHFQMKRIQRAHTARLAARINHGEIDDADNEQNEVIALTQRLFQGTSAASAQPAEPKPAPSKPDRDARGPIMTVSPIDPDDPSLLINHLQRTQTGCAWLLEQWAALRSLLERDLAWQASDTLKAVRLLGRRPAAAVDRMEIARLFLASHVLRNQEGDPFRDVVSDLRPDNAPLDEHTLRARRYERLAPKDSRAARQVLLDVVDQAAAELQERADILRERAEQMLPYTADLLSWDDTREGERLRRYESMCQRTWFRVLDLLMKLRSSRPDVDRATLASIAHSVPRVELEDWMTDRLVPYAASAVTPASAPSEANDPQASVGYHPPSGPSGYVPPQRGEGCAPNQANSAVGSAPSEADSVVATAPIEANSPVQPPSSTRLEGQKDLRIDTPHRDRKPAGIGTTSRKPCHPAIERVLGSGKSTLLDLTPIFGQR
jgi:hypothetical protein